MTGQPLKTHRIPVPVVDLPLGATEDQVVGALDLERALSQGVKAFKPGLLTQANRGFLHIDGVRVPIPRRIRGRIRVEPEQLFNFATPLDATGCDQSGPIARQARIEVDWQQPGQRWSGHACLESNESDGPVDRAFTEWAWSRAPERRQHPPPRSATWRPSKPIAAACARCASSATAR